MLVVCVVVLAHLELEVDLLVALFAVRAALRCLFHGHV